MPALMTGKFGTIQIVVREACVLLDVQSVERGTDGHAYRSHSLATLSCNEALRLRGLLNDALASVMSVLIRHDTSRNVTQH